MTNGEKIKEIFPNLEISPDPYSPSIDIYVGGIMMMRIDRNWWNAEYQEPTAKNDLGVDCISREQSLVAISNLYPCIPRVDFNGSLRKWVDKYKPYIECEDAIKQLPSVTPH